MNNFLLKLKTKFPFIYVVYYLLKLNRKNLYEGGIQHFGNANADKIFFVIKLNFPKLGIFGIYNCVLGYIKYANKHNYIPVVDLKNYKNMYLYDDEIGKKNAWEYFFEQPSQYSLEDVYRSSNVIISSGMSPTEGHPYSLYLLLNNKYLRKDFFRIIGSQIKIKKEILQSAINTSNSLIQGKRIVGVSTRGKTLINVKGHAVQPNIDDLIRLTKDKMEKWQCPYVYLATEEEETVRIFSKHFGNNLIVDKRERFKYKETTNILIEPDRENDKYIGGIEYLTSVIVLSRCTSLIGTAIGSTLGAMELNGNTYEHTFIYNLGMY